METADIGALERDNVVDVKPRRARFDKAVQGCLVCPRRNRTNLGSPSFTLTSPDRSPTLRGLEIPALRPVKLFSVLRSGTRGKRSPPVFLLAGFCGYSLSTTEDIAHSALPSLRRSYRRVPVFTWFVVDIVPETTRKCIIPRGRILAYVDQANPKKLLFFTKIPPPLFK